MAHTYNPSTRVAEAGGSLMSSDQPGLQSERELQKDLVSKT